MALTQYCPAVGVLQIDAELTPGQREIVVCSALLAQVVSQLETGIPFWTMFWTITSRLVCPTTSCNVFQMKKAWAKSIMVKTTPTKMERTNAASTAVAPSSELRSPHFRRVAGVIVIGCGRPFAPLPIPERTRFRRSMACRSATRLLRHI